LSSLLPDGAQAMKFRVTYLWFGLPVLIAVLWFLAFYIPVSSFVNKQRNELSTAQRTRETMDKSVKDLLEIRKRDAQARSSLDGMSRNMPVYQQFPAVIKAVAESGKKEGVVFETLNSVVLPNDYQQSPALIKPALDIGLKGRFLDIAKFLEGMERQKGFKRIADGKVSYADKDYPVLTGKFLIEFRAWKGDYSH
jgi:Tfp pilus assembly protein PilO